MRDVPRVVALRVPGFAAAAARRREPALAGLPLVLGAPRGGVWRVVAVSLEAAGPACEWGCRSRRPRGSARPWCAGRSSRPTWRASGSTCWPRWRRTWPWSPLGRARRYFAYRGDP